VLVYQRVAYFLDKLIFWPTEEVNSPTTWAFCRVNFASVNALLPVQIFYYIRVGIKRPYDCILCLFPFSSLDVMNHIELGCYGSSCGLLFSSMVAMMWVTLVLSFLEHGTMVGHDTRILTPFFGQGFSSLRFFKPLLTRSLGTIRYLMIHAIRLQKNHI